MRASPVATSMEPVKPISELVGEKAHIDWHTAPGVCTHRFEARQHSAVMRSNVQSTTEAMLREPSARQVAPSELARTCPSISTSHKYTAALRFAATCPSTSAASPDMSTHDATNSLMKPITVTV